MINVFKDQAYRFSLKILNLISVPKIGRNSVNVFKFEIRNDFILTKGCIIAKTFTHAMFCKVSTYLSILEKPYQNCLQGLLKLPISANFRKILYTSTQLSKKIFGTLFFYVDIHNLCKS